MRGRKPTPTAQRILAGNPGKRAINAAEPQLPAADLAVPPELDGDAYAISAWNRLAPMLGAARVITAGDRDLLLLYCQALSHKQDAQLQLRKVGLVVASAKDKTIYARNPFFTPWRFTALLIAKLAAELGLTPSSRSRVKADGDPMFPNSDDDFAEFDEQPRTH